MQQKSYKEKKRKKIHTSEKFFLLLFFKLSIVFTGKETILKILNNCRKKYTIICYFIVKRKYKLRRLE